MIQCNNALSHSMNYVLNDLVRQKKKLRDLLILRQNQCGVMIWVWKRVAKRGISLGLTQVTRIIYLFPKVPNLIITLHIFLVCIDNHMISTACYLIIFLRYYWYTFICDHFCTTDNFIRLIFPGYYLCTYVCNKFTLIVL